MNVCLFDIDGTLLDTGGAGQAAMESALTSEFGADKAVEGVSTAGRTDRAITADMFRFFGFEETAENWQRFVSAYLEFLPEHLEARNGAVLPGIPALLETLSARDDVLLGLLTGNYAQGARLKLEHYRLHEHFQFGGFGDKHYHRDDVAREAIVELGRHYDGDVEIERVWVIGDTPADVACARAIGARVVAVSTGLYSSGELESADPDHLFADFADPAPLLELLQ